jgi:hypothetical protein
MAEIPFKSGPLAIPMMLIALLAAGALVPHLTSPSISQAPRADSGRTGEGGASMVSPNLDSEHVTNALDLLAEYFGVDTSDQQWSGDPAATIRRAAVRHATSIEFLLATVPDPIDSYETWQFDPQIDAVRQGIEASGYLLDRFFLPDTGIDPKASSATLPSGHEIHKHWPGVILFRKKQDPISLLVLFLIPETPVAGIHQEPFRRAMEFVDEWTECEGGPTERGIRILGPTFSGSTRSIVRALVNFDRARTRESRREVAIVSGSASNDTNRRLFEDPELDLQWLHVQFRATMHSNSAVSAGMEKFLKDADITGITASLAESSTAYGSEVTRKVRSREEEGVNGAQDKPPAVTVKYPFNIAQLRMDAGRDGGGRHDPAAGVIPTLRPLSFEDQTVPTDQFPLRNPATMSSTVELVLSTLLEAIRREHVRIVNIDATDVRDKLFLIKEVRERAPNVLITSTDGDLFDVHPDQARWLTGLVVASTYPLHISSQDFVYPFHGSSGARRPNGDLMQFSSVNMEGHYNAAIALLNYTIGGMPLDKYAASPQGDYPQLPKLLDYGGIGPDCTQDGQPGVWISIIGDGQIIPLRVYCGLDEKMNLNYVFRPKLAVSALPESTHDVSATGPTMILIAVVLIAGTLAVALAWHTAKGGRPATVGALGLALCGALIPLLALAVILPAEAWQLASAEDETWPALGVSVASVWCWSQVAYAIAFQFRSRSLAALRAVFGAAALLLGWYVLQQLAAAPQLFLQRALDVGTKMSPLLPLTAFGGVPVGLAAVELTRLKAFGLVLKQSTKGVAECCQSWRSTLDSVAPLAPKGLTGIQDALVNSYRTLFFLPGWWKALPILSTVVAFASAFAVDPRPVLSVEGRLFGWNVVAIVLCLEWVLTTAIAQFLYLSCATAQLLTRLGRHPRSRPWDLVPRELSQTGLVPRAPRLRDLAPLTDGMADALCALQQDLEAKPTPRWFQSVTWRLIQDRLATIAAGHAGTSDSGEHACDDRFTAISVVLIVRELLSRLSFSLYLIGPALALLVVLYSTLYFDHAHALLGLIWVDVLSAITVIMSVFVWMDRDAIISGIRHTTPGTIDWNWDFVWKVVVYVVLPLATLFAAQFPGVGSGVIKILEPVQKLPGL